jgi:hypothetical protein
MNDRLHATRPDFLLQSQALITLIAVCIAYANLYPGGWGSSALLFLAPDVSRLPCI